MGRAIRRYHPRMRTTVEDLGVWRTAKRLLDQLGEDAAAHVAEQARDRLDAGDIASLRRCQRILFAVDKLKRQAN